MERRRAARHRSGHDAGARPIRCGQSWVPAELRLRAGATPSRGADRDPLALVDSSRRPSPRDAGLRGHRRRVSREGAGFGNRCLPDQHSDRSGALRIPAAVRNPAHAPVRAPLRADAHDRLSKGDHRGDLGVADRSAWSDRLGALVASGPARRGRNRCGRAKHLRRSTSLACRHRAVRGSRGGHHRANPSAAAVGVARDRMHRCWSRRARGDQADAGPRRARELLVHHVRHWGWHGDRHRIGRSARALRRGIELDERCRVAGADSMDLGTRRSRRSALHFPSGSRSPELARRRRNPHADQDRACASDVARGCVGNPSSRRVARGPEVAVDEHRAVCARRCSGDRIRHMDGALA
jgi:hypothetical protein